MSTSCPSGAAAGPSPSVTYVAPPLPAGARVLLVGAHPDDETIGAGRLVAAHAGPVRAVTLSAGERCVVDDRLDPDRLASRRLEEWRVATARLGVEPIESPRWSDGELAAHEPEIAAALVDLLAGTDVLVGVWRHDPHPDHQAAGRACAQAADRAGVALVEYPVWAPYWMEPEAVDDLGHRLVAVAGTTSGDAARAAALAAYTSQTGPLLDGVDPVVPAAMLACHDRQLVAVPRA